MGQRYRKAQHAPGENQSSRRECLCSTLAMACGALQRESTKVACRRGVVGMWQRLHPSIASRSHSTSQTCMGQVTARRHRSARRDSLWPERFVCEVAQTVSPKPDNNHGEAFCASARGVGQRYRKAEHASGEHQSSRRECLCSTLAMACDALLCLYEEVSYRRGVVGMWQRHHPSIASRSHSSMHGESDCKTAEFCPKRSLMKWSDKS